MTSSAASETDSARKRTGARPASWPARVAGSRRAAVAVAAGQVHVEQHDVRPLLLDDLRRRCRRRGGLADDLERRRVELGLARRSGTCGGRRRGRGGSVRGSAPWSGCSGWVCGSIRRRVGGLGRRSRGLGGGSGRLSGRLGGGSAGGWRPAGAARPRCRRRARRIAAVPPWRSIRPMIDSRTPSRSSGTASRSKPGAVVADERLDARPGRPRRRPTPAAPRVPDGVEQRLAQRLDQRVPPLVHRPVAGDDELDRDAVEVLDLVRPPR